MKQRETLTNEQARESIEVDYLCHEEARKPQPEDEFHKVVPFLSPSSRILRTVAAFVLIFWTSQVDYFLLVHDVKIKNKSMENSNTTYPPCGRRGTWDYKRLVNVIVCVSLAVGRVRVNMPEFTRYFYCLIF